MTKLGLVAVLTSLLVSGCFPSFPEYKGKRDSGEPGTDTNRQTLRDGAVVGDGPRAGASGGTGDDANGPATDAPVLRVDAPMGAVDTAKPTDGPPTPMTMVDAMVGPPACAMMACNATKADGCCPENCGFQKDVDCPGCGNGRVDPGEDCDGKTDCDMKVAACEKQTSDAKVFKATLDLAKCTLSCGEQGRGCVPDGVCGGGCTPVTDHDCSGCGNGKLETGEACEGKADCDAKAAADCPKKETNEKTYSAVVDEAKCTWTCKSADRMCVTGDKFCKPGCSPAQDHECAGCGNEVLDQGEKCDPPSACLSQSNSCTKKKVGDVNKCTFECVDFTCGTDGDGQCPGVGCTYDKDKDCKQENGATCTSGDGSCKSGNCVNGVCCSTSACPACQKCNKDGKAGTCTPITDGATDTSCAIGEQVCRTTVNSAKCTKPNGSACTSATADQCYSSRCSNTGKCCSGDDCIETTNQPLGATCNGDSQCGSGFCTNGHCCSVRSCGSECSKCDHTGTCAALTYTGSNFYSFNCNSNGGVCVEGKCTSKFSGACTIGGDDSFWCEPGFTCQYISSGDVSACAP